MLGALVLAALAGKPNWCTRDRFYECEDRIPALAGLMTEAAERFELDPTWLVAMAWVETRWNPWAVGPRGSKGVLQIHPVHGCVDPFLCSEPMREWCRTEADGCQRPIVMFAAGLLARKIERCGNVRRALGWYNRGRCGGARKYVRAVVEARKRFAPDARRGRGGRLGLDGQAPRLPRSIHEWQRPAIDPGGAAAGRAVFTPGPVLRRVGERLPGARGEGP